ncbi:MAG TPA: RNA 2',3'-cyclic phosphodiesterase [Geobacteraceae bacterium]|nr:RNA 2',3'-cyclic phosphodiesterase [Geobacteraceae bacterium]
MYRLFIAIDLPEQVKEAVAGIAGELPGARPVPREQIHLTLRFIGEVDEEMFLAIKRVLSTVSGAPFPLTLKGVGHFPPGRYPRVLWVGMEESGPLRELQKKVELALIGAGVAAEERGFSPHITIARLKETPPAKVAVLEEKHNLFVAEPFPVGEFYLYSSTLAREGAIHKREATCRLSPADPM